VDSPFEQALDARIRASVTEAQVHSLFRGRLVLQLEAGPPAGWTLAYEFDHAENTYHYGIAALGLGPPIGWVAPGPTAVTKRTSWGSRPLDLSAALTGPDEATFDLDLLLPASEEMVSWEIKDHPTGQRLALVEEFARALEVGPRPQSILPFHVLRPILSDGLVLTADLRRPPRSVYDCAEVGSPVGWEDAGDLSLELYRRMVGEPTDRAAYQEVQTLFTQLTGHHLAVRADLVPAPAEQPAGFAPRVVGNPPYLQFDAVTSATGYHMHIRPVVTTDAGDIPVEFAGAGVWEALVACAAAVSVPGRVVLLDEPAANLHPSWQRQLLSHLATLNQVVLITHSPNLVPARRVEDLARITRLYPRAGKTAMSRLADAEVPKGWWVRWRQILTGSADARSALFARGVVLLEGETELGAFGVWFADSTVTGDSVQTVDALNLALLVAESDSAFGAYVSYLNAVGVPWVIICDGPVLSPGYRKKSLLHQLQEAGVALDSPPDFDAPFTDWKAFWWAQGVFTVANRFGGVTDENDKGGEIEAFLQRTDGTLWREVWAQYGNSKARTGHAFAEQVDLAAHPEQLAELAGIWAAITSRLIA